MNRSEIISRSMAAFMLLVFIGAVAGCSSGKAPEHTEEKAVDTKSGGVIPAYQLNALEKAKGVGDMADQHRKDMDNQGI